MAAGMIPVDAAEVEPARYVVLLKCGHWTQTWPGSAPGDGVWRCPAGEHGESVTAARDGTDGRAAVLASWDYWTRS